MGNCLAPCSCHGAFKAKSKKVLQIVKMDGKILEFKTPALVRDVLVNFSSIGIGLSKSALERLPPDCELKLGKVYYFLPPSSSGSTEASTAKEHNSSMADTRAVKRIKVLITKQQLQQLLSKQLTMEEILSSQKKNSCYIIDESTNWKPKLESIPEGIE
ncbi:hypothetical protein SLEP1_g34943 [Rubroshorea leprosula]|uniref:Uncharacterized protein n=1 Tax=Rubroshorea leprosula TaxID=152421 RepID=A0AAV5KLY9_9ROSI|nr:hypothetical protein SLEP1_g34943 [Rubroshorea leprosula]